MEYFVKIPFLKNIVAKNLKQPRKGPIGWYLSNVFFKRSIILLRNASKMCNIQPDYKVLELGSGPGYGLIQAAKYVEGGTGKIYGLDISEYMVKESSKRCKHLIESNKVEIIQGSVENIPFDNSSIDRIFHANCFYFWPDMDKAVKEIARVMKPESEMVAVMNRALLKEFSDMGYLKYGNTDPERYMKSLENNGFENVNMEHAKDRNFAFQMIIAKRR